LYFDDFFFLTFNISQQEKIKPPKSSTQSHDYSKSKLIATKMLAAISILVISTSSMPATSTPKVSSSTSATSTPKVSSSMPATSTPKVSSSTSATSTPKVSPSMSVTSSKKSKIDTMRDYYKDIRIPETFLDRKGSLLPLCQFDDTPDLVAGIIC